MTQEQIDTYLATASIKQLAERVYSRQITIPKAHDSGPRYADELTRKELVTLLERDFIKLARQEAQQT